MSRYRFEVVGASGRMYEVPAEVWNRVAAEHKRVTARRDVSRERRLTCAEMFDGEKFVRFIFGDDALDADDGRASSPQGGTP